MGMYPFTFKKKPVVQQGKEGSVMHGMCCIICCIPDSESGARFRVNEKQDYKIRNLNTERPSTSSQAFE